MVFTVRSLLLFALAGALMWLLSPVISPLGGLAVFDGCWLVLVLWDCILTASRRKILVARRVMSPLSVGHENTVEIEVSNQGALPAKVTICDDAPPGWEVSTRELSAAVPPGGSASCFYSAKPLRRGDYQFGSLWIRVEGVLGLVRRQFTISARQTVKVLPNIANVREYELLAIKGRLQEAGMKPVRFFGGGTEFESLREYHRDDDFRTINWKASARKGRLITEHYEVDRSQQIILALDTGRLMEEEIHGLAKLDHALNAALLLSYVAMKKDDRVGLVTFSREIGPYMAPGRGKGHFLSMLARVRDLATSRDEPDFGVLADFLALKNRKRSLVVLFTDFQGEESSRAAVEHIRQLYPRHLPLCVLLGNPRLHETAQSFPEDSGTVYRKALAQELLWERQVLTARMRTGGVTVLDGDPARLAPMLIKTYMEIKHKMKL
ncbi:MAG: DUF58 domain-containing protein [Candidatus Eremiobacteraeota bacterium]|nr:DUF58 domain-containing protein [Candidatus Eremiobacteraeota bacterium]